MALLPKPKTSQERFSDLERDGFIESAISTRAVIYFISAYGSDVTGGRDDESGERTWRVLPSSTIVQVSPSLFPYVDA